MRPVSHVTLRLQGPRWKHLQGVSTLQHRHYSILSTTAAINSNRTYNSITNSKSLPNFHNQRRTFLIPPFQSSFSSSSSSSPPQTLTETRTLPYHRAALYTLIADIASYPNFLPYCISSQITSYSAPETQVSGGRRWPRTAELRVGYGPYEEVWRSRVYCAPYGELEALAGKAAAVGSGKEEEQGVGTGIDKGLLGHYFDGQERDAEKEMELNQEESALFNSLRTRWTFRDLSEDTKARSGAVAGVEAKLSGQQPTGTGLPQTEVNLVIEVQFASPVYAALSQAAAPKVAGLMVEAFEKRAREVLGSGSNSSGEPAVLEGEVT